MLTATNSQKKHLVAFALIFAAVLEGVFVALGVNPLNFPLFVLVFLITTYVPGSLLVFSLRLDCSPIERLTLELGSGYCLTTLVYFLCRLINFEPLYFLVVGLCLLGYVYLIYSGKLTLPRLSLRKDLFSFLFIGTFCLIMLFSGWLSFFSWLPNKDDGLRIAALMSRDDISHNGLVRELSHTFPPYNYFAGNSKLLYHFFSDLYAAFFVRNFQMPPADLTMRFLVVFHLTLFFLSVYVLAKKLYDDRHIALFTVFLTSFLGNLGFLYPLLPSVYQHYLELQFLPIILSLHLFPYLISFSYLFLGFFSLLNYEKGASKNWLFYGFFFLIILSFYRTFTLLHIFMGLIIPGVFLFWQRRQKYLLFLLCCLGATGLMWGLAIQFYSPFRATSFKFHPWFLVYVSLFSQNADFFGAFDASYFEYRQLMFNSGLGSFLKYFVGYGTIFFIGTLGLRVLGLRGFLRDLKEISVNPTRAFIAYTILWGMLFSAFVTISLDPYNTGKFLLLAVYLLTFHAAGPLFDLLQKKSTMIKALIIIALLFNLITSVDLLIKRPTDNIPAPLLRLAAFIENKASPGEIIAYPPGIYFGSLFPALSGVRSLIEDSFPVEVFIGQAKANQLIETAEEIYRNGNPAVLKKILSKHKIAYVLEFPGSTIKSNKNGLLKVVYQADGFTLNRVIN